MPSMRRELGLEPGDRLIVRIEDGVVLLLTPAQAIRQAQAIVQRYAKRSGLAEELLRDRRAEAGSE